MTTTTTTEPWAPGQPLWRRPRELGEQIVRRLFEVKADDAIFAAIMRRDNAWCPDCDVVWRFDGLVIVDACWCCGSRDWLAPGIDHPLRWWPTA